MKTSHKGFCSYSPPHPAPSRFTHVLYPFNFVSSFSFFSQTKYNFCCPHALQYVAFHCSVAHYPGRTLKENCLSFSHEPPTVNSSLAWDGISAPLCWFCPFMLSTSSYPTPILKSLLRIKLPSCYCLLNCLSLFVGGFWALSSVPLIYESISLVCDLLFPSKTTGFCISELKSTLTFSWAINSPLHGQQQ